MAAESAKRRRQPSRLQRCAPASMQINGSAEWKVAIPLLSPVGSPTAPFIQALEVDLREDGHHLHHQISAGADQKPVVVFKKWQAAPFCYEPAALASFVRVDGSRS